MIYFAIREKDTDKYLPQGDKKKGGYTSDEPTPLDSRPPRLFMERHHAQLALDCWLKGVWSHDFEDYMLAWKKVPGRNADNMEIVGVLPCFGEAEGE